MTIEPDYPRLGYLLGAWLVYFSIHSLLASLRMKRWVEHRRSDWLAFYRLAFNAVAVILLIPPLWIMFTSRGALLWQWSGPWLWAANTLAGAALLGFWWSLRYYDSGEFLGLRQWRRREKRVEDQERFHISPLHRFVRHPWYSLGLVLIWTRDMDAAFLVSAITITGYIVLGSRLEEHKLLEYHERAYRDYRQRVPGLVPLPWRYLKKDEAEVLLRQDAKDPLEH